MEINMEMPRFFWLLVSVEATSQSFGPQVRSEVRAKFLDLLDEVTFFGCFGLTRFFFWGEDIFYNFLRFFFVKMGGEIGGNVG